MHCLGRDGYDEVMVAATQKVAVFAPSPVLTVTVESGADGSDVHMHAGGQGSWVANMVSVLGARPLLCAPFGGEIGTVLLSLLKGERLELRQVDAEGSNGCRIEDRRDGEISKLAEMPGAVLNRHEFDDLYDQTLTAGIEAGVAVLTGPAGRPVVEADIYRRLAADLTSLGVLVVADLSGDPLEAAVAGGVAVLKVSDEDVGDRDPVMAAETWRDLVDRAVILTRAAEPALIIGDEVAAIDMPTLETLDHRGAGDSLTAGVAVGLARGLSLYDAIRLGAAAGAVNVTRHGLASGRLDAIETMAEQVVIEPATSLEVQRARTGHQ
jgi:1-phosphofructokinase